LVQLFSISSSKAFSTECTLGTNKTPFQTLIDTCAAGGNYINESTAQKICKLENITPFELQSPLLLSAFNGVKAHTVTHALTISMQLGRHYEDNCTFNITNLGKKDLIIGIEWMEQHGCIPNPVTREVLFLGGFCTHRGAPKVIPFEELVQERGIQEKTSNYLPEQSSPTKRRNHRGLSKAQQRRRDKKKRITTGTPFQRSIRCTLPAMVDEDEAREYYESWEPIEQVACISAISASTLIGQPEVQIAAISMKDIMDQHTKEKTDDIDPRELLPEMYHPFVEAFSKKKSDSVPPHRKSDFKVELEEGKHPDWIPRLYRMTREEMAEVKRWVTENLSKGFIKASQSPWASPILFVKKPGGGIRLCFDYRKLNAITKKDRYPIPLIDETMANIAGCKVMTKLDIRKAFNRIRVAEDSEDLLTFCTPVGNFKPTVMGFGPCNGPATFQRYINETLFEYLNVFCTAYLDDVLIYSQNLEEHQEHVKLVLQRLIDAGLEVDIRKCEFHVTKTKFLGLIVSIDGLEMDPEKIEVVKDWEVPTNITEAQGFIGFCNFYRRFIASFSNIVAALTRLTKKDAAFAFDHACWEAFTRLKNAFCSAPVLRHFDPDLTCTVEADSSDYVTAGILSQPDEYGVLRPVAYFSSRLNPAKYNYKIYDKELLAIVRCFK